MTDLLDNGPKNELYLQKDQAVIFNIKTNREVQIGLKALDASTTYTINNGDTKTLNASTDMFYTVVNAGGATSGQTITITNTGEGILSITEIKICDDPNAAFGSLTEEDLIPALLSLGFKCEAGATAEPTAEPTSEPTAEPTAEPTSEPTAEPTTEPTSEPTAEPTTEPTAEPTPVVTPAPTPAPTNPPVPVVPQNPIQGFLNIVRSILNRWFGW
ncbi:MAG: PT domain-containing protein [Hominenteromicrobium sp.]